MQGWTTACVYGSPPSRGSHGTGRQGGEMSISNRKPGEKKEAPAEPLKRSIAGTMKAIARKPDREVTFASDRPALMGQEKARLPDPPRRLTLQDVAILRGN